MLKRGAFGGVHRELEQRLLCFELRTGRAEVGLRRDTIFGRRKPGLGSLQRARGSNPAPLFPTLSHTMYGV